jgi:hypothetical protein
VITPAGSVKISQGKRWATAMRAMSTGLRVTAEASHGKAMAPTPSPRFEIALAVHNRQYRPPRGTLAGAAFSVLTSSPGCRFRPAAKAG